MEIRRKLSVKNVFEYNNTVCNENNNGVLKLFGQITTFSCEHLCSVKFTLLVDDSGIKYTDVDNVNHLLNVLKNHYEISEDWTVSLYCV